MDTETMMGVARVITALAETMNRTQLMDAAAELDAMAASEQPGRPARHFYESCAQTVRTYAEMKDRQ